MKRYYMIFVPGVLLVFVLSFVSCSSKAIHKEPFEDDFFEKTQIIMSRNEVKIYKHLPDKESREKFAEDFWKLRDPNPETDENENKIEFERRIEFADKWFREKVGSGRGWESDRGKVYILLGEPDERNTQQETIIDRTNTEKRVLVEYWVYQYYRLSLRFVDDGSFSIYHLDQWSTDLLSAIERAKFEISKPDPDAISMKFNVKFSKDEIIINIPTKNITFEEKDGKMMAQFNIKVMVYNEFKKIDEVETTREVVNTKEAFLGMKSIELKIPYTPKTKGNYSFDVVVKDEHSGSRYRDMANTKI